MKRAQLRNYPPADRWTAVADAFYAIPPNLDGGPRRADVTYDDNYDGELTVRGVQLLGMAHNITRVGTTQALVIRMTFGSHACEFIPFTRLISITEPKPEDSP